MSNLVEYSNQGLKIIDIEVIKDNWFYEINQNWINDFFWDLENMKLQGINKRMEMYPESVIIDLYKDYYQKKYNHKINIWWEISFFYRNELIKFLSDDFKKLNIIERSISTNWNQPKHQKKYLKYKKDILEYRLRVLKFFNFLKSELLKTDSKIWKINYDDITNINDLKISIENNLNKLKMIFFDWLIDLKEKENLKNERWINKFFTWLFWTISYWEKNIIKNEIDSMIWLVSDKLLEDKSFIENLLNKKNINHNLNSIIKHTQWAICKELK